MPTSYQEPAGGTKSTKFVTGNPLDPILRPFAHEDAVCLAVVGCVCSLSASLSAVLLTNLTYFIPELAARR
jgi:hypothetical protein